jgi:UDP-N-acetyl-D-glucosamine/UDP-N-acetyl-D-galactosamine dehydrogenase
LIFFVLQELIIDTTKKKQMPRKISVIGLGYVGLPVAIAFAKNSKVICFDINEKRLAELRQGHDSTNEVEAIDLKFADIHFTSNPEDLSQADFHIVAVPTPINEAKQPDLRPLLSATKTVGNILKAGDIVVYESTVYPGCTEEDCVPILEKQSGLKYLNSSAHSSLSVKQKNHDNTDINHKPQNTNHETSIGFFLGYSPERINPGDKEHTFTNIKKVISGSTPEALEIIANTYSSVVKVGVYKATSIKVAEAAKVIENAQRDLNIAFVNELALIFNHLNIDTHEVLEAAGTKWNFLPFRPGLVGGHCIGVDPYYLTHRAQRAGYHPQVILSGRQINDSMGTFVAQQTVKAISANQNGIASPTVTVLGLTFKEDCPDLRNSRVPDIISELEQFGCRVQTHDPLCDPEEAQQEYGLTLLDETDLLPAHAVVLAVAHKEYLNWSIAQWIKVLLSGCVFMDIQGKMPTKQLQSEGYIIWRL